ncbi:uncharacterized protein DFL_005518 [Arthrobotrys flagrans]|uniref:Uncharacterized protein n=1 Tax=Arthrobotrys flagrans TaxID=97331 RepID=A0A436ZXQ7_ARTFL|nr:hypothetical protein DFL_005518 [Arthrobotrys flagrans]
MKFFTVLAVAVLPLAFASPIEIPEALQKRACNNYNAVTACSNACPSVALKACSSCNGNPSCVSACYSARLSQCKACCVAKCATC